MMAGGSPLLPLEEAQARLLGLVEPVAAEEVALADAIGRWCRAPVRARRDQPFADLSAMDGYAVRAADLPGPWQVVGESAAGSELGRALSAGEAARIFTGAPLPKGADCVIVQEDVRRDGNRLILTGEGPAHPARHIRGKASDFVSDSIILPAGSALTAGRIALAASAGVIRLPVNRPVRVHILSTGNELIPPGEAGPPDKLPASNALMLRAMLASLPVQFVDGGIIPDDRDLLVKALETAADADIIVTSGGASVGDHDHVRPALEAAGGTLDFWRIALRPGKPLIAGRLGKALLLGLPGNPVSAHVTALLFLLPLVRALAGASDPLPAFNQAPLAEALPANGPRTHFLRARWEDGTLAPLRRQDSAGLSALASADALIRNEPNAPALPAGHMVSYLPLG